uniref:Uncharacterized protein n=1 Tax=Picea sitchensis TaxID=3332 RepID=A9NXG5_PICSI|nr:unknown [Picea sitchensis]
MENTAGSATADVPESYLAMAWMPAAKPTTHASKHTTEII